MSPAEELVPKTTPDLVLDVLKDFIPKNGRGPTTNELARETGKSQGAVGMAMHTLRKRGAIDFEPGNYQTTQILPEGGRAAQKSAKKRAKKTAKKGARKAAAKRIGRPPKKLARVRLGASSTAGPLGDVVELLEMLKTRVRDDADATLESIDAIVDKLAPYRESFATLLKSIR